MSGQRTVPLFLFFSACVLAVLALDAGAQPAPERGPRHVDPRWHAITGATLIPQPGQRIENATIVFRDGVVVEVGAGLTPPAGARVHDRTGLTIYAGFVESHLPIEVPAPSEDDRGNHPHRDRVMPQRSALDAAGPDAKLKKEMRSLGFTAAAIAPEDGNFRGQAAVVSLEDDSSETENEGAEVIRASAYQAMSLGRARFRFNPSGPRRSRYPTSQMGAIALIRQTFSDADWHAECLEVFSRNPRLERPMPSDALEALGPGGPGGPLLFLDTRNELEVLRGAKIAAEFQRPMAILGSGNELRRLGPIADAGLPIVVPVAYPEASTMTNTARMPTGPAGSTAM